MKAKKIIALILSLVLIFSAVPTFAMLAGAEDVVSQAEDDEEFVAEYRGSRWVKADNYVVNLSKAFSNLASSVMYSGLGLFWTALIPVASIPIAVIGGSTIIGALYKFGKALAGFKV